MGLFAELKRRNVFRVGIAYAIAAWVLLQVVDVVSPILQLPSWFPSAVFVLLAVGFVPALIFAWAFELTPEGLKKEKEVDRDKSITQLTGRKLDFIIIGVLSVGIVLLIVDRNIGRDAAAPGVGTDRSIAVLPFANMTDDPAQSYFSDGISEEILNELAKVAELRVAGRTSSFAFRNGSHDLREIGNILGVDHILEGSVRKSGNRVRVTAQLIKADDGFHVWSESYDRELDDVFAIQEDIAGEILGQLKAELVVTGRAHVRVERTDPVVYDRYLMARQRLYMRTTPAIKAADELLAQALAADSDYAPAWAQRAIASLLLADDAYGTVPKDEADRTGLRYAERALEIDPDLAEGWAAIGLYHVARPGETQQAIDALSRAIEINPNLLDARNWLNIALQSTGDVRGAMELLVDLNERDPLYKPALGNGVGLYASFGEYEKARMLIERYRRFDPHDPNLLHAEAMLTLAQGRSAVAHDLLSRAHELAPNDGVINNLYAISLINNQLIEDLAAQGLYGWQVDALDWLGRRDEALEVARREAERDFPFALFGTLNRLDRGEELIAYAEERWSTLEALAEAYPAGNYGKSLLLDMAVAYQRSGRPDKAAEALGYVEQAIVRLETMGINHLVFDMNKAELLAMQGEFDEAFELVGKAIDRGWQSYPDLAMGFSGFYMLRDDPRMLEFDVLMTANINAERATLGLDPIEPRNGAWRAHLAAAND